MKEDNDLKSNDFIVRDIQENYRKISATCMPGFVYVGFAESVENMAIMW